MNDADQAPDPTPPAAEAPGLTVRRLMRSCDRAALATSLIDGAPYASLVLFALDLDATPLLLLSDLAEHSRNIGRDCRVSLLIDGTGGLTDRLMARFIARHPSAAGYAGFADFKLYQMTPARAHLVAGFGRIRWLDGDEIILGGDCRALTAAEPSILAHMNADHGDAVNRIVGEGMGWHMTGIDPEGADFRRAGQIARAAFAIDVRDAGAARTELVRLARAG